MTHLGMIYLLENGFYVLNNQNVKSLVKLIKIIINYYNKKLINNLGTNSQLFCRIEKRSDDKINIGNEPLLMED